MGSSPNYRANCFVPLIIRCRNIIYTQKGPIILRTSRRNHNTVGSVLGVPLFLETTICVFSIVPSIDIRAARSVPPPEILRVPKTRGVVTRRYGRAMWYVPACVPALKISCQER